MFSDASHTHISRKEDWDGQQRKSSDCPYKVTAGVRGSRESSSSSRRPCTLARTDGPELVRSMCYLSRSSFFFIDREKCNLRSRPLSDWDVISGGAVSSRDFVSLAVGNKYPRAAGAMTNWPAGFTRRAGLFVLELLRRLSATPGYCRTALQHI